MVLNGCSERGVYETFWALGEYFIAGRRLLGTTIAGLSKSQKPGCVGIRIAYSRNAAGLSRHTSSSRSAHTGQQMSVSTRQCHGDAPQGPTDHAPRSMPTGLRSLMDDWRSCLSPVDPWFRCGAAMGFLARQQGVSEPGRSLSKVAAGVLVSLGKEDAVVRR